MRADEFWSRAERTPNGCWEWHGARSGQYRMVSFDGKTIGAHRAAWLMAKGAIPDGMFVCHRCDNPPCVNPEHLFLGTPTDNVHDMLNKGRHVPPTGMRNWAARNPERARGERNGTAKLTDAQVAEIKSALADGARPAALAETYGVKSATIYAIRRGDNWGDRHGSMYRSLERVVSALGANKTLREWSAEFAVRPATIAARLAKGWDPDVAVSKPTRRWPSSEA
jgi:hypothetical protein